MGPSPRIRLRGGSLPEGSGDRDVPTAPSSTNGCLRSKPRAFVLDLVLSKGLILHIRIILGYRNIDRYIDIYIYMIIYDILGKWDDYWFVHLWVIFSAFRPIFTVSSWSVESVALLWNLQRHSMAPGFCTSAPWISFGSRSFSKSADLKTSAQRQVVFLHRSTYHCQPTNGWKGLERYVQDCCSMFAS